ncbi:hydrogenase maturation nickel metallochaperone HypA [uncultured Metabacillus sp.]|uniref:hydrogenase maturation nickel metallochaperone HypA/HybF n=2 Tax=uncultured Metabacillus sp. TaxID=2860135 RepID=UPI002603F714|nr:hydrogenase maturation nickel metallochaperone HypA [uncultured Metabacillus sp.]
MVNTVESPLFPCPLILTQERYVTKVLFNKAKHKHLREIITEGVLRMHEMSLMLEIIKIVSENARLHGFSKVDKIDVIVGDLSNVLPAALELAFFHFRKQGLGILDENTELDIIREPAKAKCQTCLVEFIPDYRLTLCPMCGLPNCLLISGETFRIESYEGSDEL